MAGFGLFKRFPGLSWLLILELILFIVVSYQVQVDSRLSLLEKMGLIVFGPIQQMNHRLVGSFSRYIVDRRTNTQLLEENQSLRKTMTQFDLVQSRLAELEKENERLRRALDLPAEENWRMVHCEVIGRTHRRDDYMITINKGGNHGIRRDQGVFCSEGVVGIVWEVSGNYSKIMTVNNPSAVVAALVQNTRYLEAYVQGMGASGRLLNFPNFEKTQPNDLVLTSGLDGVFPKGLHIGRVGGTDPRSKITKEINIKFSTDFSRLETVTVLTPREVPE